MAAERLDFVIYGASGYTGKFVVQEVARKAQKQTSLTWAVAGRSRAKLLTCLKSVEQDLGIDLSSIEVIIAQTDDYDSLVNMATKCKVVINCVGPYSAHGEAVIRACVENSTGQVDLSGEHEFIEKMMFLYNQKAKDSGCYIVSACGTGFISEEIILLSARKEFTGKLAAVELYGAICTEGETIALNFGTFHSMMETLNNQSELKKVRKQQPEVILPRPSYQLPSRILPKFIDGQYYVIGDNTAINRTQKEEFRVNGVEPVDYRSNMNVGSITTLIKALFSLTVIMLMNLTSYGHSLLMKYPRLFTFGVIHKDGPPVEMIKQQSFVTTVKCYGYSSAQGQGTPDKEMTLKLSGPDPAYITASSMIVEAAYTLAREQDKLPDSGGVMTPGFAFKHSTLMERLSDSVIKFEVIST